VAYYSHSKLETYLKCPQQYWFRYIAKIKSDEVGVEAYMGIHVHTVLETACRDSINGELRPLNDYMAMFRKLYFDGLGPHVFIVMEDKTYQFYYERGLNCVYDYFANNKLPQPGDDVHFERKIEFKIVGGKHTLIGYIDHLEFRPMDGTDKKLAIITDYKSGKKVPSRREVAEHVQLSIYDLGIRTIHPEVGETELNLYYLMHNKIFHTFRSDEDRAQTDFYLENTIKKIEEATKNDEFPCEKQFLCEWCVYKAICPAFEGSQRN
jgi:RecB family exonuclease